MVYFGIMFSLLLFKGDFLESHMNHQQFPIQQEWKEENLPPFDELILSWNAIRPLNGKFLFYVRVKTDRWSPWILYSSWGKEGQSSFQHTSQDNSVRVYQDVLAVLEGKKGVAFQIKIMTEGSLSLNNIHGLHVYTNGAQHVSQKQNLCTHSIHIMVPGLSQMTLDHKRHLDLCSPTSTTAVVRYLAKDYTIDPLLFAQEVWDSGCDIFGNWVFNVAEASQHLGSIWNCWVERLQGFDTIYSYLEEGTPVIVSVRGPLEGSASAYAKGHLLAVIGYDAIEQKVICMDPAFPRDQETHVTYGLSSFIEAWGRRGNIAYIFKQKTKEMDL